MAHGRCFIFMYAATPAIEWTNKLVRKAQRKIALQLSATEQLKGSWRIQLRCNEPAKSSLSGRKTDAMHQAYGSVT
eukprot:m.6420 g.6420  ORF g.6420 m.6420 type:complete len:76 (+) comp15825_c0_seq1:1835-2062(+)